MTYGRGRGMLPSLCPACPLVTLPMTPGMSFHDPHAALSHVRMAGTKPMRRCPFSTPLPSPPPLAKSRCTFLVQGVGAGLLRGWDVCTGWGRSGNRQKHTQMPRCLGFGGSSWGLSWKNEIQVWRQRLYFVNFWGRAGAKGFISLAVCFKWNSPGMACGGTVLKI